MSPTPMPAAAPVRNLAIDLMRGLCMLYIVGFWHLMNYTKAYPGYFNPVTTRVTVTVLGLFTLISGYLIGRKNIPFHASGLAGYFRNRFLRIYPPFLLALLAFFALHWIKAGTLIKSALLIAIFSGPTPPTLWYITMIVCFYAIAPLLMVARQRSALSFVLACAALESLTMAAVYMSGQTDVRLCMYFPCFVAGMYLAQYPLRRPKIGLMCAVLLLALGVVWAGPDPTTVEAQLWSTPLALAGSASVFLWMTGPWIRVTRLPAWLHQLAYASFFMYLIHRPVFATMSKLWAPQAGGLALLYLWAGVLLITALAWHLQRLYDRHQPRLDRLLFRGAAASTSTAP
jgi:peptidoglycan/LPS O-acetylase OafA/YrhL